MGVDLGWLELFFSSWGFLIILCVALLFLTGGMWIALTKVGSVVGKGTSTKYKHIGYGGGAGLIYPLFAFAIILTTFAFLVIYSDIRTGLPFLPDRDMNLVFVGMIVAFVVGIFSLAMVAMYNYARIGLHSKAFESQKTGGSS